MDDKSKLQKSQNYARIYSVFGLEEMIENAKLEIKLKEKDKNDVGKTWTASHIRNHKRTIDQEVVELNEEIKELEAALEIKNKDIIYK